MWSLCMAASHLLEGLGSSTGLWLEKVSKFKPHLLSAKQASLVQRKSTQKKRPRRQSRFQRFLPNSSHWGQSKTPRTMILSTETPSTTHPLRYTDIWHKCTAWGIHKGSKSQEHTHTTKVQPCSCYPLLYDKASQNNNHLYSRLGRALQGRINPALYCQLVWFNEGKMLTHMAGSWYWLSVGTSTGTVIQNTDKRLLLVAAWPPHSLVAGFQQWASQENKT